MPAEVPWTVLRLLATTREYLQKKQVEKPLLDAEVLLASVFECERVRLYTRYNEEVAAADLAKYRELIRQRATGAPVAYLVGRKEFYSLPFAVSPAVLIPRGDSENVVVEALDRLKGVESPRLVDVGTGSGCLALAIAKHHPSVRAVAIDLSPEALAVARQNAESLGLADRVEFRVGDLLGPLVDDPPVDLIVSNPPYIPAATVATLDPTVARFEPHLALDGGPDGLRVVARLVEQAAPRLKPGGHFVLEIGHDQEAAVRDLVAAQAEFDLAPTIRDAGNQPRVIRATRKRAADAS